MLVALELLKRFWPYIVAAVGGFIVAWGIQGLRLTAAEQAFVQYKQAQAQVAIDAETVARKQREESANEYAKNLSALQRQVAAGETYRRCVAAGKCGVRVTTACAGIRLPSAGGADGLPTVELSSPARTAEAELPGEVMPVVSDCAQTTLMLNQLQADIERQPGY